MFNIFKKIKNTTEEKTYKYAQKNIDEISKILNRPKEGEIVRICNIKISKDFKKPRSYKLKRRLKYFKKNGYFRSTIVLNNANYLIDGYTTYLLAKEKGFDYITIVRKD